ncbi:unnamed protein product [Leptosia nina]|uniref:Farnesoic acid O-methyl transferase domain-containing protein n=1 Tax=Leptosia nina TaxID=320188 RepID=A0AAV1JH33_9NEOP
MKFLYCLYFFVVWKSISAFQFTDSMAKQCKGFIKKTKHTYGPFYMVASEEIRKFKSDSTIDFEMHFAIMGPSDGHILLSDEAKQTNGSYEIAIGAGRNTFVDIRGKDSISKNSTIIKDILSPGEYRAFHIKQYNDGTIALTREGDRQPLVFYKDPTPIRIEFFSFSTWSEIEGKFYFDCPVPNISKKTNITQVKIQECKLFTSKTNCTYDTFFNTKGNNRPNIKLDPWIDFEMHFEVMAANDAHLLLSTEARDSYLNGPVYEIAIGNDSNSVTELRKYYESLRSDWALTPNILSASEFKYFNIKIYKAGSIVLSKDGVSEPILNIVDYNPISVKYFSFDTSDNVEAKFLYGCSDMNETAKKIFEGQYERGCKTYIRQQGGNFNKFIKAEDLEYNNRNEDVTFEMNFAVLAAQDAHFLLSTVPNLAGPIYDIGIGIDSNQMTEIRRSYDEISGEFAVTHNILSPTKYKQFYTKVYKDGTIELGMEGSLRPILNFTDTKAVPVNFFSFSAGSSMDAKFRYDCPKPDLSDSTE